MSMIALLYVTVLGSISANRPPSFDDPSKSVVVEAESTLTIPKSSQERYQEFLVTAALEARKARLDTLRQSGIDIQQAIFANPAALSFHLNGENAVAMIESLTSMTSVQGARMAPAWFAAIAIVIVFLGVPLIFLCLFPEQFIAADFGQMGKKGAPGQTLEEAARMKGDYQPPYASSQKNLARSQSSESAPPGATMLSPFTAAMSANMSFVEQHRSPESASRAVWSMSSGPPPLCAAIAPAQSTTSFYVDKAALRALFNHRRIEIMDRYSKVAAYASLSRAAGGTRLVIACEPSCSDPVATVGPLDYPANLDSQAMLHGPHRELYGAFERFGEGFSVSHFSRVGHVFTSSPKKVANGLVVEISAGSTQLASAWLMRYKEHCQIDVNAGMDITLMLTAVLATSVASQHVIDEV